MTKRDILLSDIFKSYNLSSGQHMEDFSLPEIWHNHNHKHAADYNIPSYLSLADHLPAVIHNLNIVTSCLPAQHHSLNCTAETLAGHKTAHMAKQLLVFWSCAHSYFQKQRMCCIQAFHKFVTVYSYGTEILIKDIFSCSSTPSPASQETHRFKACKTALANTQRIYRWNVEVYLSILIHFKFIKTPRLGWILHNQTIVQIQKFTSFQNYAWSYAETADSSQESQVSRNAQDKTGVCLCFILFHCPSRNKKSQLLPVNIPFSCAATHCFHALRSFFFSFQQSFNSLHRNIFVDATY